MAIALFLFSNSSVRFANAAEPSTTRASTATDAVWWTGQALRELRAIEKPRTRLSTLQTLANFAAQPLHDDNRPILFEVLDGLAKSEDKVTAAEATELRESWAKIPERERVLKLKPRVDPATAKNVIKYERILETLLASHPDDPLIDELVADAERVAERLNDWDGLAKVYGRLAAE